jgi:hypothetical protein
MKNKLLYLGIGALTIAMASCSNDYLESLTTSTAKQKGLITATVENNGAATRVGFDSDGKFYWTAGDEIGVLDSQDSFTKMTLVEGGEGTQEGSFTTDEDITIDEDYGCAVYPYFKDDVNIHECQPAYNRLNYYLRPTYTYNGLDTDFFTGDKDEKQSFNVPLFGKITKDDDGNRSVTFKHIGGVICVKIPSIPIDEGYFILSSEVTGADAMSIGDGYITGIFQTSMDENAQIKTSNAYGKGNGNTVIIHFTDATPSQSGVFYVPVPTGTYSTVTIKLVDNADNPTKTYAYVQRSNVTVDRGMLYGIILDETSVSKEGNAVITTKVDSADDVYDALSKEDNAAAILTNVTLKNSSLSVCKIPGVTSSANTTKYLTIKATDGDGGFVIQDVSGDNPVEDLIVALPSSLDGGVYTYANSNVTFVPISESSAIKTMSVSSNNNDIIVESGMSIQYLMVDFGTLYVKKGAKIVSLSTEGTKVFVIVEDGGQVDTFNMFAYDASKISIPDGLKFALTYDGDLSAALTEEIEVSEPIEVIGNKVLDLNGKAIKTSSDYNSDYIFKVKSGASLTIKDSVGEGTISSDIIVEDGGSLN